MLSFWLGERRKIDLATAIDNSMKKKAFATLESKEEMKACSRLE